MCLKHETPIHRVFCTSSSPSRTSCLISSVFSTSIDSRVITFTIENSMSAAKTNIRQVDIQTSIAYKNKFVFRYLLQSLTQTQTHPPSYPPPIHAHARTHARTRAHTHTHTHTPTYTHTFIHYQPSRRLPHLDVGDSRQSLVDDGAL